MVVVIIIPKKNQNGQENQRIIHFYLRRDRTVTDQSDHGRKYQGIDTDDYISLIISDLKQITWVLESFPIQGLSFSSGFIFWLFVKKLVSIGNDSFGDKQRINLGFPYHFFFCVSQGLNRIITSYPVLLMAQKNSDKNFILIFTIFDDPFQPWKTTTF